MKKNNETWLAFFKKTLKVSWYFILGLLVLLTIFIYMAATHDPKTYLACEDKEGEKIHMAFNDYRIFLFWDPLNEEFEQSFNIVEMNKKFIKAEFYASTNDEEKKGLSLSTSIPNATWVYTGHFTLDREIGKYTIEFDDPSMKGGERNCEKISKRTLPITKVDQKF